MGTTPQLKRAIGNEAATTLASLLSSLGTTIQVSDGSVFDADGGYAIIDEGTTAEEVVYIESVSGNTLTVSSDGRGLAGTSAVEHSTGAAITDIIVKEMFNDTVTAFKVEHDDDGGHKQLDAQIVASGNAITTSNKLIDQSGGIEITDTLTYASASDPEFTLTVTGDYTSTVYAGMIIKLTQTTDKFFFITKVEYSDPTTTITLYGGTDYDLADAAITSPFVYLPGVKPLGFPMNPAKWSVSVSSAAYSKTSPTTNTWYATGNSITIPTGLWTVTMKANLYIGSNIPVGTQIDAKGEVTLSTTTNSETLPGMTYVTRIVQNTSSNLVHVFPIFQSAILELSTSDTYNALIRATTSANIIQYTYESSSNRYYLKATIAYL
jgi:hypothetical protein